MSQQLNSLYDDAADFETLLNDASASAINEWEMKFVDDLGARFEKYGDKMYLSNQQQETLERIAKR